MEGVIYTDGHGTKVTTQEFITGNTTYLIRGIMEARMNQIKASLLPAITLLILGVIAFAAGFLHLFNHEEIVQFLNLQKGSHHFTCFRHIFHQLGKYSWHDLP